jgi:Mn-dependent DtxR family transcriptional regulator
MNKEKNELSACEEDYIEMIYRLCGEHHDFTRVVDLAAALNVKPPSVTKMIKKLGERGYLKYIKYGIIELEDSGRRIGKDLLFRHNTIEAFLNLLNIKEDILEETEKIEHTINAETLLGIRRLLYFFAQNPKSKSEYIDFISKQ